jgi:hypothetical protein
MALIESPSLPGLSLLSWHGNVGRSRQPAGSLPGAAIEEGGTQHGGRRGELGRVPTGTLAVELLGDGGHDGHDASVVLAGRGEGEGDVERAAVDRADRRLHRHETATGDTAGVTGARG